MSRHTPAGLLAVAVLALLVAPSAAAPGVGAATGPFLGVLQGGEHNTHRYDNNPTNQPCIDVIVHYEVSMSYAPIADTLTLKAGGREATGTNGGAKVFFPASACTSFTIEVAGTAVAAAAAYEVHVISWGTGGVPW